MTTQLDIISGYLFGKDIRFCRIDGNTAQSEREQLIAAFNDSECQPPYLIFLLSTRAGAVGINLQSADTVILFDR